jgi:hypothetical protein
MLNKIKNYLETHMNEILISIEQYKALFDIIFPYGFVISMYYKTFNSYTFTFLKTFME